MQVLAKQLKSVVQSSITGLPRLPDRGSTKLSEVRACQLACGVSALLCTRELVMMHVAIAPPTDRILTLAAVGTCLSAGMPGFGQTDGTMIARK